MERKDNRNSSYHSEGHISERIAGRIPPHNDDAEAALLGSILLRSKAFYDVQSMICKEEFYQKRNQLIWDAMVCLLNDRPGMTIDLVSLTQYMKQKGTLEEAGGVAYLSDLTNRVPTSTIATYYAELIHSTFLKRSLLDLSVWIGDRVFDETSDVQQTIDSIDAEISKISMHSSVNNYIVSGELINEVVDNVNNIEWGKLSNGIPSGFRILDKYIGGFKPSELIIIAARPSVGKTAFALTIAANMAYGNNPVPVGFFSLEMSGSSLMERVIANRGQINLMKFRNGRMDSKTRERMMDVAAGLYEYSNNLIIQDTPNIKLLEIRSQARRLVRECQVKAIFIDYIGLVDLNSSNANMPRHEQVSQISRSLKQLARELRIPVICLCQVNREGSKDRPPMLADLRDSGSIEQDADLVLLLDDPSKRLDEKGRIAQYEEEDLDSKSGSDCSVRPIKVIIAKQRNGNTGAFKLNFISDYVCFKEIERF